MKAAVCSDWLESSLLSRFENKMAKIGIGQTIGILANLGVIAGILFLAVGIQQNNDLLTSQASYAQFNIERERRSRLIENRNGIYDIVEKARQGEQLSETEAGRLFLLRNDILDSLRWQFREVSARRLPDDLIDLRIWREFYTAPGFSELYQDVKGELEPDFVEFMERNVVLYVQTQ